MPWRDGGLELLSVMCTWFLSTPGHNGKAGTTGTAGARPQRLLEKCSWFVGPETAIFCKTQSAAQLSLKIPLYVLDNKAQNYSLY